MYNTASCSHELKITGTKSALRSGEIFMIHITFKHVSYSFLSAMWVIRKTCRRINSKMV